MDPKSDYGRDSYWIAIRKKGDGMNQKSWLRNQLDGRVNNGTSKSGLLIKGRTALAALSLSFLLLGGCTTPELMSRVPLSHTKQYDDIPTAPGFVLDTSPSGTWVYRVFDQARGLPMRSCCLLYRGERPVRDLVPWYKRQMAQHDWRLQSVQDGDATVLHFSKGSELAELTLERVLDRLGNEPITEIRCRIRPR